MSNELDDNTAGAFVEEDTAPASSPASSSPAPAQAAGKPQIVKDVLIEEVSIDGMCGVY